MTDLVKVELKNLFRTQNQGGGVFLGNDDKSFAIFIGPAELNALILAGGGIAVQRPLTHNLLNMILSGFDIEVKSVVISDLVEDAFHANLTLAQGDHEVVIDCRPSDALIIAVMRRIPVFVKRDLFERVEDGNELRASMHEEAKRSEGPAEEAGKAKGKRPAPRRGKRPAPAEQEAGAGEPEPEEAEGAAEGKAKPKGESPEGGLGDVRSVEGIDWGSLFKK